ncbi:MAG: hypothetical protein R3C16_03685 [Hyphomonadaceae bacterium]
MRAPIDVALSVEADAAALGEGHVDAGHGAGDERDLVLAQVVVIAAAIAETRRGAKPEKRMSSPSLMNRVKRVGVMSPCGSRKLTPSDGYAWRDRSSAVAILAVKLSNPTNPTTTSLRKSIAIYLLLP